MRVLRFIAVVLCALPAGAQTAPAPVPPQEQPAVARSGIVQQIEFLGLRRIPEATVRAHIRSREGQPLDAQLVQDDVRALDRLGWFDSVTAEAHPLPVLLADATAAPPLPLEPRLRLVFRVVERPFLAAVEFRGSHALSGEEITATLAAAGVELRPARPLDRNALWRATRALRAALAERAHPLAKVRARLEPVPTSAVRAVVEITDGPRVEVAEVHFEGQRAFSAGKLREQMKRVAPDALLAGMRGRAIYTPQRLEEDLRRLERFYHDHGYPLARLGPPRVDLVDHRDRRWLPWPRTDEGPAYRIVIPVEEGPLYRFRAVEFDRTAPRVAERWRAEPAGIAPGAPYSLSKLEQARERLQRAQVGDGSAAGASQTELVVVQQFDPQAATVDVTFRARPTQPYLVRRIEFLGHHRFSDRYYRKRIGLAEGQPFDAAKLEEGLAALASSGFIRPVTAADIDLELDEQHRAADLTIRIEEAGRQRLSLVGGAAGLGSTVGLAWNVFDLFGGEELLTAHFEFGPQSLQAMLGVAKEGLFGTRASTGLSLYRHVIRPVVAGEDGPERLFTSDSSGIETRWRYPLGRRDALSLRFEASTTATRIPLAEPLPGLPEEDNLLLRRARRVVGAGWSHAGPGEQFTLAADYSGGPLGGDEDALRSTVEYARLEADPLTGGRNTWAFRAFLAGVGSHSRRALPRDARFYAGEQLVRGFRTGELAPYEVQRLPQADGSTRWRAQPAGANLLAVWNAEYRVPLRDRLDLAAFADFGAGWLLPRWLGGGATTLLAPTNGVLRASTGLELRFRLPLLNQPVRFFYAINPLRLTETFLLPDGSLFRARERRSAFGFALGSLF